MERRGALIAAGVAGLVLAVLAVTWLLDPVVPDPLGTPSPTPSPSATAAPAPQAHAEGTVLKVRPGAPCQPRATAPFTPSRIAIRGVTSGSAVLAVGRDASGIPGVPPLTTTGKWQFAWDPARPPGTPAGNVLLNAHTWPDGSALGNALLAGLDVGDRIEVAGAGRSLCYRVGEEVQVTAEQGLERYYATDGPPQLAIVVCSGVRRGPGDWSHRTVWFAQVAS